MKQDRFFFFHIMKTAGSTFWLHIRSNFAPRDMYPSTQRAREAFSIKDLLSLPQSELDSIQVFCGHFPYVTAELVGFQGTTMTTLRHPVDRTVSFLRHQRRLSLKHYKSSLEDMYADPDIFKQFVWNHQAKNFAMLPDDPLDTCRDVIEVDSRRFDIAKANLGKVDIIGLQESFGDFLDEVERRFGWNCRGEFRRRASPGREEVSDDLKKRIAADNAIDMEFYEFAKKLVAERARGKQAAVA